MSIPQNVLIEALETQDQKITFERVVEALGAVEKAVTNFESKRLAVELANKMA